MGRGSTPLSSPAEPGQPQQPRHCSIPPGENMAEGQHAEHDGNDVGIALEDTERAREEPADILKRQRPQHQGGAGGQNQCRGKAGRITHGAYYQRLRRPGKERPLVAG